VMHLHLRRRCNCSCISGIGPYLWPCSRGIDCNQ
jgi:hypothetical protein